MADDEHERIACEIAAGERARYLLAVEMGPMALLRLLAAVFAAGFVAGGVDLIANQPDPFVGFHRGQPTRSTCSTSGLRRNLPRGPRLPAEPPPSVAGSPHLPI